MRGREHGRAQEWGVDMRDGEGLEIRLQKHLEEDAPVILRLGRQLIPLTSRSLGLVPVSFGIQDTSILLGAPPHERAMLLQCP